jgi:hypothetical protein
MRYEPHDVSPNLIGGNPSNNVTSPVRGATIGGGGVALGDTDPLYDGEAPNRVADDYGTVGGGYANVAGNDADGTSNSPFATVAGGQWNTASGGGSAVAGGRGNTASGVDASIGGGQVNSASGPWSAIAGGIHGTASGMSSTVGGGSSNRATGVGATIGGGGIRGCGPNCNSVEGNQAIGSASTVPGGLANVAGGDFSFAAGRRAKALGNGAFAFADSNNFDFSSNTDNAFRVRATGGVRFVVDIDGAGAMLQWCLLNSATGGWSCVSDRDAKQDLVALDGQAVLDKLDSMPIYAWSPKGRSPHVRHYGPMAQDFHAAFGLGDDATMIGMQDADGVALAAIKGLNAKVERELSDRDRLIDEQRAALARQQSDLERLRALVDTLLARDTERRLDRVQ